MFRRIYRILTNPSGTHFGIRIFRKGNESMVSQPSLEYIADIRPLPIRFNLRQDELMADPFVFMKDGTLYCFYEAKNQIEPGKIRVLSIRPDKKFQVSNCELGLDCHVSYPFIFFAEKANQCYMIPETGALREVALYEADNFPVKWIKKKVLITGDYVDSHLLFFEGTYYLFTTQKTKNNGSQSIDYQLNIFYSDALSGDYHPHPNNPVCTGRKYSRSGGGIVYENGMMYRMAQDCSTSYGRELHVIRIKKLTRTEYEEEMWLENWVKHTLQNEFGGHHLSLFNTEKGAYLAVDVNYKDWYIQRFINPIIKTKIFKNQYIKNYKKY